MSTEESGDKESTRGQTQFHCDGTRDTNAAANTSMRDAEISDFKDHLAVFLTVKSTVHRGSIPQFIASDTVEHSWSRVQAYVDAYNVRPAIDSNPVPRALRVLRQSDDHRGVAAFLSESEWSLEERALARLYEDDDSFHLIVADTDEMPADG
ncbi:hypothetical protein [environmental halophage 1 AAJ-2005]|nr:hypothetical protein [environmental halophage 1 AAJ-2005]